MKVASRKIILLLIVLLMTTVVSACRNSSNNEDATSGASPGASQGEAAEPEGLTMDGEKYSPAVTMTTARGVGPSVSFVEGESIEDNVHTRWVEENLGIKIKYLWTTSNANDAFKTKLRLTLSANEPLPDVLTVPTDVAHELIDSGKFQPVGELFDNYAGEVWKAAMDEVPAEWYPYIREGKKYGIPNLDYKMSNNNVMWIREDWLTKLNLQPPKTIEELEKVMEAFRNDDPDGNGVKDTVPLVLALKTIAHSWVNTGWIFGAYGALPEAWVKDDSGKLVYGSTLPGTKQGLGKIQEWMKAGYIHKEAALHDETKAYQLFTAGTSGIMVAPTWADAWPLKETVTNVPGAKIKAYPLPVGPGGKAGQLSGPTHYMVTLISKDMKNPEIYFRYMNYFYDNYANPSEDSPFVDGLAEGYDYVIKDGTPTSDRAAVEEVTGHKFIRVQDYLLSEPAPRIPSLQINAISKLHAGGKPETPFERKMASIYTPEGGQTVQIALDQAEFAHNNEFVGNPTPTMNAKRELLTKLEKDIFGRIHYGREPLDAFDKFVEEWKRLGGDQITQEVNDWYQSVQGN
ncbi:extracellular solute-binding protein [Paenibacillus sp. CF384]|uniref:extracellular solute-binding protein n=1 Tax=Paenibacillus sp. CF384 TaxID=1884382 RepID=UPI00089D03C9|nr:extracellular solute-binding protein [Paenibacillus sp. CF384]SDX93152.1 putative aldouronate transport system substrate-binding protein [Paenibacillus sp. CF384]